MTPPRSVLPMLPMLPMQSGVDLDALPCAVLRLDADGRILHANRAAQALIDAAPADAAVPRGSVDRMLSGAGRVMFHNYLVPLLQLHGRVNEFALEIAQADGSTHDALVYAGAGAAADERRAYDLVLAPLRERRRLEDELLRVKAAADAAPGVVFEALQAPDGACRMTYASETLRKLYGLRPAQLAQSVDALLARVHPDDRAGLVRSFAAAVGEGRWRHLYRVVDREGRVSWHEVNARGRLLASGERQWNGSLADVSDRLQMEVALRDRDAAQRASRAKSEFLSRLSHELRTPLNAIIGFGWLLANSRTSPPSAEQRERLQQIDAASQALLTMINEVLDITRIEAGALHLALAPVCVRDAVERALDMLAAQAADMQVTLSFDGAERLPPASADPDRLQQVLLNLVGNAIKYNRRGGSVRVSMCVSAERVQIAVIDTGIGMSAAQLAEMFQPFNRLGAERLRVDGAGLGLVIARRLVEAMDGEIEVSSHFGQGSEFRVLLRIAQPLASLDAVAAAA